MLKKVNSFSIVTIIFFSIIFAASNGFAQNNKSRKISSETLRQISAVLQEKQQRVSQKRRQPTGEISSQLATAVKEAKGENLVSGIDAPKSDLVKNDKGYVAVSIEAEVSKELLSYIESIGGEVIFASSEDNFLQAYVPLSEVENLATQNKVKKIDAAQKVKINRAKETPNQLFNFLTVNPLQNIGAVTSEGDVTHRANLARSIFNINGSGVKVGVLSDSVRFLQQSQASGDLPPNVTVIPGQSGIRSDGGDTGEGTAMLEIIHDLAPGAQLFFASGAPAGLQNPVAFANNIRALRNAGCNIIIDDLAAFTAFIDGTPFQDATIAAAINDVTASGVLYLSSAGNAGNLNDGRSGVWEGDFSDSGVVIPDDEGNPIARIHDFGNDNLVNTILTQDLTFYWSDAISRSANDYFLVLLDPDGNVIFVSDTVQDGNDNPFERITTSDGSVINGFGVLIAAKLNAQPRALHLNANRGLLSIATAGQIRGHNGAANALSIAATPAGPAVFTPFGGPIGPFPAPFSFFNEVERFSSDGPRRIFYNPNGSAISPNNFLFATRGGRLLNKPEFTAADGVSTTLDPNSGLNPFFGTSAAAPHAGAIAALVKSANPNLNRQQVISILNASAIDIEAAGRDRDSGRGIIDAFRAVSAARGGSGSSGSCSSRIENGVCTVTRCVNGDCTTETFPPTTSRPCSCQISSSSRN